MKKMLLVGWKNIIMLAALFAFQAWPRLTAGLPQLVLRSFILAILHNKSIQTCDKTARY